MSKPTEPPTEQLLALPPHVSTAIVAAGTAVTFASLDPGTIRTVLAPAVPRPVIAVPILHHIASVMSGLQLLRDQVDNPGVGLCEAEFSPDGRTVTLPVWSIDELSDWYVAHRRRCGAMVMSRPDGGLDWRLTLGEVVPGVRLVAETESSEGEVLPDTALVRAMFPAEARLRAIREREAAAARRLGWVA